MVSERELDGWMDRLAGGDRAAFTPLFRALWPRALGAARRRLEPGAADDVAQTTMLKVFAHADRFRRGSPVLPWFYAILGNEIRAGSRVKRHEGDAERVAAAGDPEQVLIEGELRRSLAQALAALDGASAQAIAAVLGEASRPVVESAAFRKRVSRAYARLRVLLGVKS